MQPDELFELPGGATVDYSERAIVTAPDSTL